ncbi:ATP-binding protein [Gammaproteobacteria bacterium]|nr:ATP-binding protein [Gammaproteobacteria bacterium]
MTARPSPIKFSPRIGKLEFVTGGKEAFEASVLDRQIEHSAIGIIIAVIAMVAFLLDDWRQFNSYWQIDYAIYVWMLLYAAIYCVMGWCWLTFKRMIDGGIEQVPAQRKRRMIWLIMVTLTVVCVVSSAAAWVYGSEQTVMGFALTYYLTSFLLSHRDRFLYSVFFASLYAGITAIGYFVLPGSAFDIALHHPGTSFRAFDQSAYFGNLMTGVGLNLFLNFIGLFTYRWAADAFNQSLIAERTIKDLVTANSSLNDGMKQQTDALHRICQELKIPTPQGLKYGQISEKINNLSLENARAVRQLREANATFEGFIARTRDGVTTIGPHGQCIDANPAFLEMMEMPIEQFRHQTVGSLIHPDELGNTRKFFRLLREQGNYSDFVVRVITGKGNERILQISGSANYDRDGKFSGSRNILRDITQQHEQEQALLGARNAEKNFLARMSHEIRTPLNAIIGITHLLSNTNTDPRQREYVEILENASQFLLNLLNGMLDMAKIQSGQMELNPRRFSPNKVVQNLQRTFSFKLKEKPVKVELELDPTMPKSVYGDEFVLTQILFNLIGNADKFTREGSITIGTRVLETGKNWVSLEFTVADTGIGITETDQALIFDQFAQVRDAQNTGGTGLGLALCREFAALLKGTVGVESQPEHGSVFTVSVKFDLIANTPDTPKVEPQESQPELSTLRGKRALLVDDSAFNMLYLQTLLENHGVVVSKAINGKVAVTIASDQPFDMILMDLHMPLMNGFEAAQAIRDGSGPNRSTPIYALTASVLAEHQHSAKSHGMNGFLAKPFTPAQLYELVQQND